NINFTACELNSNSINEMKLNMYLNNINQFKVKQCDVLMELPEDGNGDLITFDRIISDPPFALKWDSREAKKDKYNRYKYGVPSSSNADWAFIQTAIKCLNNIGSSALVVSRGALVREQDKDIRMGIIEDDLIEGVISLPPSLYYGTGIPVEIIVINKKKASSRKNKILFINASEEFMKGGRTQNYLSEEQLDRIIKTFKCGIEVEKYSKFVEVDTVREYKYSLNTKEYIEYESLKGKLDEAIYLGDVAKLMRGVSISKQDFEDLKSENGYYFINLKDIKNQRINYEQAEQIELKKSIWMEKYTIKEGDLIITAKGSSFKTCIANKGDKNTIISSNLMIIRLDKDKYSPVVLNQYLNSSFGIKMIESIFTGSEMKVLSTTKLATLSIPKYDKNIMKELDRLIKDNTSTYNRKIEEANEEYSEKNNEISLIMGIN
ncbi:MAG: N-6 DNA methylase, partial [Clostridium sp.]